VDESAEAVASLERSRLWWSWRPRGVSAPHSPMTAPHRSRAELEARLDFLQQFFTQLDEFRGLDAEDCEALIMVQARRAQPKHYEERLKLSEAGRAAVGCENSIMLLEDATRPGVCVPETRPGFPGTAFGPI
jgi:hypothetical protein